MSKICGNSSRLDFRRKDFITRHYYTCNKQILAQLGQMYAAGGEFTKNINAAGGPGAAEFAARAIEYYCRGEEI